MQNLVTNECLVYSGQIQRKHFSCFLTLSPVIVQLGPDPAVKIPYTKEREKQAGPTYG